MKSAFGVEHGDIEKAFGGAVGGAIGRTAVAGSKQARGFKAGYQGTRANAKAARQSQGLATNFRGSVKQGFNAGRQAGSVRGGFQAGRSLAGQQMGASRTGYARTMGR